MTCQVTCSFALTARLLQACSGSCWRVFGGCCLHHDTSFSLRASFSRRSQAKLPYTLISRSRLAGHSGTGAGKGMRKTARIDCRRPGRSHGWQAAVYRSYCTDVDRHARSRPLQRVSTRDGTVISMISYSSAEMLYTVDARLCCE